VQPKIIAAWILGLVLTTGALFATGYTNPFVLDAVNKIQVNPDVRSSQFRWEVYFDAYSADQAKGSHLRNDPSRPVTYFCYWFLWKIGGGEPWPFHLFSLTLHLLSALLLGLIVLQLAGGPVSAIEGSFLFLLLPLNIGVAFYPFALSDVLATTFTLLILYLSLRPAGWARDLTAGLAFILACGAKQSAVIIPALVLVLNPRDRRLFLQLTGLAALYLGLRFLQFGRLGDLEASATFPPLDYFLAQGVMIFKYAKLLFIPDNFSLDHWSRPDDYNLAVKILAWLFIGGFTFASLRQLRIRWSWLAAGWLLFLIPLLPVSSFLPTTDLFVERRAYLSSMGFILMFAGGVLRSRNQVGLIFAVVWVVIFAVASFKRVHLYSSAENIYKEALELYPGDARNLNNLATLQLQGGRFEAAQTNLESVLKIDPNNVEALSNLGAIHQLPEAGRLDLGKAEGYYLRALQLDPSHVNAMQNLGFLKLSQGRAEAAKEFFTKALALNPRSAIILTGLGKAEQTLRNIPAAIQYFRAALAEEPGHPLATKALNELR
jgi:tetratricopeptide (TPR) repeat protein